MQRDLLFTGNITRDIDFTPTREGKPRARFTLVVNEGERGSDNEKSQFLPHTAFGELAEALEKSNITTKTRLNVLSRVDNYKRAVKVDGRGPDEGKLVDIELNVPGYRAMDVSPSMRFASVQITPLPFKDAKGGGNSSTNDEAPARKAPAARSAAPAPKKETVPATAADNGFDDEDF